MQSVSAVSSDSYVSFMLMLGDDILGCHLPRNDALEFSNQLAALLKSKDDGDLMPEIDFETESMNIQVMASMDAVMYLFTNKLDDSNMQLALDEDTTKELMNCLGNVEKSSNVIHGPIQSTSSPWKFFGIKKAS